MLSRKLGVFPIKLGNNPHLLQNGFLRRLSVDTAPKPGVLSTLRRWRAAFFGRLGLKCRTMKDVKNRPLDPEVLHFRIHILSDLAQVAHPLQLPENIRVEFLDTTLAVEEAIRPILEAADGSSSRLLVSMDTEREIMKVVGVSVMQLAFHSTPERIFIIPVHKFERDGLPPSLMQPLTSSHILKIGNQVNSDIKTLQRQFQQLRDQKSFATVDLQTFCVEHGVIRPGDLDGLQVLLAKVLGKYMVKKPSDYDCWEGRTLNKTMLNGAALDVYAIRLIYEKAAAQPVVPLVHSDTEPGTSVNLLGRVGWFMETVARGRIALTQPERYGSVDVKTPEKDRLLIEITELVEPDQGARFYPRPGEHKGRRSAKALYMTLGQLRKLAGDGPFNIVWPISNLELPRVAGDAETLQTP